MVLTVKILTSVQPKMIVLLMPIAKIGQESMNVFATRAIKETGPTAKMKTSVKKTYTFVA